VAYCKAVGSSKKLVLIYHITSCHRVHACIPCGHKLINNQFIKSVAHYLPTVGIAACYGMDGRGAGIWVLVGSSLLFSGYWVALSWGREKLPRCETNHSPPMGTEVKKNANLYTHYSSYMFIVLCLIN
jgi:hypothetical protein